MSDALSEIARDEERYSEMNSFYEQLVNYLEKPSREKFDALNEAAKETDFIRGGFNSGKTDISSKLEGKINELSSGDKTSWARLLIDVYDRRNDMEGIYSRLKKLSPYADKVLFHIDYGRGFSNIDRIMEIQEMMHNKIESSGMKICDADKYLLAFDRKDFEKFLEKTSVDWVRCGIYGVKGPRKQREKLTQ